VRAAYIAPAVYRKPPARKGTGRV